MIRSAETSGLVTLINVFTVEPVNQQRLVDLLIRATDGVVNRVPGFISSTLHPSGAARKTIKPCAKTLGHCHYCRRRLPSRRSNPECTKSLELSNLPPKNPKAKRRRA
jgi:hypothetical protein